MSQSQLKSRRTSRSDWRATLIAGYLRKNTQQCVINIIQLFGWLLFAIRSDPQDESYKQSAYNPSGCFNTVTREPCKINGWLPQYQCKWGARDHLDIMHSHSILPCTCSPHGCTGLAHWLAHRAARLFIFFSLSFVYALTKTKHNKCCQYSFSTTEPLQATAPCSQALCTLPSLWNLSSLLMRLIKPSPEFV